MFRLLLIALMIVPAMVLAGDAPTEGTPETRALAAFTAREYESGVALYRGLLDVRPDDPAAPFWEMMVVRGLALDEKSGPAAEAGAAFLASRADGPWSNAVRFLVVDALVASGQEREAASTALRGLDALTAPESRARVADLYIESANAAFVGTPTGEGPFRRDGEPDFARALALYRGARRIGIRDTDHPVVAERIVRCLLATKLHGDAAAEAESALTSRPDAPNRPELMGLRAVGLARAGFSDQARHAASDLLEKYPGDVRAAEALIALGDLASLLVVRDRLADSPHAAAAAYRIAELLAKGGDAARAIEAYRLFLDRYPDHFRAAEADFRIAEVLLAAGEFDAAARAFTGHRDRFPLSTFWTRARARAVDAMYLKGKSEKDAGKDADAFAAWGGFVLAHPLDKRVPGILLAEGHWHVTNGRAEKAYAVWHELRSRYRASSHAADAALRIARLFEETIGDLTRAVTEYRAVMTDFAKSKPAEAARRRVAVLQRESLAIRLPRAFRSDEAAYLEVRSRNLQGVTVRVYDVDLAEYFRRHRTIGGLDDVLVDVIKPDEVLKSPVPDYEQYREASWRLAVPRQGAGGAIVVVEAGTLRAVTLLLVSDITVITKEWRGGALAFVQDARTGEPLSGVEILANHSQKQITKAVTGADGVARLAELSNPVRLLAVRGASVAADDFEPFRREVRGAETLAHVMTDRPLYRPGHEVSYRAIVRHRTGDRVTNPAGAKVVVRVQDKAGNDLHFVMSKLSAHGSTHGSFRLPDDLPPGDYQVTLHYRSHLQHGTFRVEEYTKPDVLLSFTPERPCVIQGEMIRGTVRAQYAFGKPIAGLVLFYTSRHTITTDAAGEATFEVPSGRPGLTRIALIGRDVARRQIALQVSVVVAERGYSVALTPDPAQITVGEEIRVGLSVLDPLGEPVARKGSVRVLHAGATETMYKPILEPLPVESGKDGLATLRLRLEKPGRYRLRYEGLDRRGELVEAECAVEVVAAKDLRRIVVRADRESYGEGETANVSLRTPSVGYALVTLEGERVYGHRVVRMDAPEGSVPLDLDAACVPEVRIRAAMAHGGELWTGDDHVRVVRQLRVEVRAEVEKYEPGDMCVVNVATTDGRGKPVSAELALAVVDEAIYALREDRTVDLARFFTPPPRADLVRTGSSLDFAYEGVSDRISEDLLAERERRKKQAKDAVMLEEDMFSDAPFEGPSTNAAIGLGGGAGGAFRGRGGRRSLRAEGGGTAASRMAAVRKDFADTAYWSGALVTGPDGKATVTFRVPDNLTTWRISGRAVTLGGASGDGFGSFRCAKDLAVLVSVPPVMRDGDGVTGAASVHNDSGEALEATLSLDAREALYGPFSGSSRSLAVGADASFDWRLEAPRPGRGLVTARVTAGTRTDAEQRTVRVLAYGVPVRTGLAGTLEAPVDWRFDVPADTVPGTLRAELRLAPSVTAQVLSALDHLDAFPYGCVEQTVNRFYPALMTAKALKALGRDEPKLRARLDEAVRAGIRRLSYLQRHDGQWGWWGRGAASSYMTAYATLGLATAQTEGYAVPDSILLKARKGIAGRLKSERDEDLRAFLRYALAHGAKKPDLSGLALAYARRSRLEARGLAWLALAYADLGAGSQVRTLAGDLAGRVEMTPQGARVRGMASGVGSPLEASALALRALLAAEVEDELTDRLALGLAAARRDGSFGTTVETGTAVVALAEYLSRRDGGESGFVVEARVNDEEPVRVEVGPENPDRERVVKLAAESILPGKNRIRVRRIGAGRGGFALSVTSVARTAPVRDEGEPDLVLERRYALQADPMKESRHWAKENSILRPGGLRREPDVSSVSVGDIVRVTLDVRVRPGLRFLQVEDPLPAGFAALEGVAVGPMEETVLREDRVVFFVADPAPRFRITYLMRTGFPGEIRVPPGRVFPMYRPEVVAYSAAREIGVTLAGKGDREFAAGLSPEAMLARARRVASDEPQIAARYARALLDRFDLTDEAATETLRLLARVSEQLGRPVDVVDAYDRLRMLVPGAALPLEDAIRLARAATAADRPGDAIQAVRRAAALLYDRDRRALKDLEGRIDADAFVASLAGRYPFGPAVEADLETFALRAADAYDGQTDGGEDGDPALLAPLEKTGALYPTSPGAAGRVLRHARSRLREGAWAALEREAALAAELYPSSATRAEADWFHAYAVFAQARYPEAIRLARKAYGHHGYRLADKTRGRSPFWRNHAHLLAQAHHILGETEKALGYYQQLRDHSADAAAVVRELTDKRLAMPSRLRVPVGETPSLRLRTRNLESVRLRAYPIDLLSYFAIRKDLAKLRSINLDGIEPAVSTTVAIPEGRDRKTHATAVALDLTGPGVFLVLAEGGGEITSGVILVSDLTVKVWSAGSNEARVRTLVTDTRTGQPVKGAYVKVAYGGKLLAGGVTDPRGVFDTVSVVRVKGSRPSELEEIPPIEEEELEISEDGRPGVNSRVMVVVELNGHAAAWW